MDLILFQPGDSSIVAEGCSTIDDAGWPTKAANKESQAVITPNTCIELVSIHQGLRQQVTTDVSNQARTSGRPVVSEFTCVKYVDGSSPLLYDRCLRAKPLDDGKTPCYIHVLRNSGDQLNLIMQFTLYNVLLSEIDFQSHPKDMPTEQLKINFSKILWNHQIQGVDNTNTAGHTAAGWDIAANAPASA